MIAHPHRLSQYESEYYVWTEYCKICGAEGLELKSPCPGNKAKNDNKAKNGNIEIKIIKSC